MGTAVAGTLIAAGALIVAGRANRRADVANAQAAVANDRAQEALDLQRRIDERAREFTDVRWEIDVDSAWSGGRFTGVAFRNVGLTPARDVTFVVEVDGWGTADVLTAEEVLPGYKAGFTSEAAAFWMDKNHDLVPLHPPFRVHWSSPLGNVVERHHEAKSIFKRPSGGEK
ncbi:hypothetical protein AB0230_07000 [Microbacterium sp. NPDC089190]|uniref:hypothetical protein n=1 Tax=Microbacterium sp. NPDC089190 TaxID=3155063 RepID=UPI00344D865D